MSQERNAVENEDRAARAELLARLASACRQIGAMMDAGVDILRITSVLRAQSEDDDILRLCDHIDWDLKRGRSIGDVLASEPTLFSPFAVSLIRQGEERNTLPASFARLADFLDRERADLLATLPASTSAAPPQVLPAPAPQVLPVPTRSETEGFVADAHARFEARSWPQFEPALRRAEARWLQAASGIGAGLLAASAISEALTLLGIVPRSWQRPLARALSAGVLANAAKKARASEPPLGMAASPAAPPREAEAVEPDEAEQDSAPPIAAPEPEEEEPLPRAVYRGAPRDDEEEEAPRVVRRPRFEEEFD